MKMENIRPNFSAMSEPDQRHFFFTYAEKRAKDFELYSMPVIRQKKTSKKEPPLKVTPAQLELLKALGLV